MGNRDKKTDREGGWLRQLISSWVQAHHSSNGIWRGKHHNSIQSRGIGWIFISVGIGAGGCIYDNFYKDSG